MTIFNSVADCILYFETCQKAFPVLNEIVKPGDFKGWVRKLEFYANPSLDDYFFTINLSRNLLYISVATGWGLLTNQESEPLRLYKQMLAKLSLYLQNFPELKANRSFRGKAQNLNELGLLPTLSELSLAYQLAASGQEVKFETKFRRADTGTVKDVDLTATDSNGEVVHYEVYMPNKDLEVEGYFDLSQDDTLFADRIKAKILDKFGNGVVNELEGSTLLAINTAFFDTLRLKNALSLAAADDAWLRTLIPEHMAGLLLFDDDFETHDSFTFVRRLMKA